MAWGGTAIFGGFFIIAPLISIRESQIRHQIKLEVPGKKTNKKITPLLPIGGSGGVKTSHQVLKIGRAWGGTVTSTLRSNNSKTINPILKYFTDLKNSDKSALIKHSHSSLRLLLLLLIILCKNCILSGGEQN